MKHCMDICDKKESTICCVECKEPDCKSRCIGMEYGVQKVDCRLLDRENEETGDEKHG